MGYCGRGTAFKIDRKIDMILKWYDSAGHWRFIDNVTLLTIVGLLNKEEAAAYVKNLNGPDSHPSYQVDYNNWNPDASYPLVSAYVKNEYEHMVLDSKPNMLFVMSDEGKTVDRF